MTIEIGFVLAVITAACILFMTDWFSADVVGLLAIVVLIIAGVVPAAQAFQGFGSDTFLLLFGLLVMSAALTRTGVIDMAGSAMLSWGGSDPNRLLLTVMVSAAVLSAFMSNTAATAFFLPVVFALARKIDQDAGQFLLPLAFASIVSSSVTLISTSTNLVVSGLLTRYEMPPMGMFELAPVGIPISIAGIAYLWFLGRKLLPTKEGMGGECDVIARRQYCSELVIMPSSPLIGKELEESGLERDLGLDVIKLVRGEAVLDSPGTETVLKAGDLLLVEAPPEEIIKIKDKAGLELKPDVKLEPTARDEDLSFVEAVLLPNSRLIGGTLKSIRFRQRFDVQVLGIERANETIRNRISKVRLRLGDVLLLQGGLQALQRLRASGLVRLLGLIEPARVRSGKARWAMGIFVAALALGTVGILPLPVAALVGAVGMFIAGCISTEDAYREIEWKVLILVGAMLGLGAAMEYTGTERYLAGLLVDAFGGYGPLALLGGFFILTVILTQPMSNQAAAVVLVPVAIQTANHLQLNPRTFAMMIAIAASCSYLTPLEPSCLMVYSSGHYHFKDFLRVGSLLTVLIFIIAMLLVPLVWPLRA